MHTSIHSVDGETHILAGLPVSPSGPPLGPTVIPFPIPAPIAALGLGDTAAGVSETGEAAMQLDSCLSVSLGGFFQTFEATDEVLLSVAADRCPPTSLSGIEMDAFNPALAVHANSPIGLILNRSSGPKIAGTVIPTVTVDMVDQCRHLDQIDAMVQRIDDSMLQEVSSGYLNSSPSGVMTGIDAASDFTSVDLIPSISFSGEMRFGPDLPSQHTSNIIKFEALSKEFDSDVFNLDHDENGPFSIGELAVRLVGNFDLPRLLVMVSPETQGGDKSPGS